MKAFEKLFPKPTNLPGPYGENHILWDWEEKREGWKAALEYVLTLEGLREPHWVFDYIKKELADD